MTPLFADFWSLYPRHVARAHAEKMWNRLKDAEKRAAMEALPKHVEFWKREQRRWADFRPPHGGTWLNGRRWEDEIDEAPQLSRQDQAFLEPFRNVMAARRGQ